MEKLQPTVKTNKQKDVFLLMNRTAQEPERLNSASFSQHFSS